MMLHDDGTPQIHQQSPSLPIPQAVLQASSVYHLPLEEVDGSPVAPALVTLIEHPSQLLADAEALGFHGISLLGGSSHESFL